MGKRISFFFFCGGFRGRHNGDRSHYRTQTLYGSGKCGMGTASSVRSGCNQRWQNASNAIGGEEHILLGFTINVNKGGGTTHPMEKLEGARRLVNLPI